MEGLSKVVPGMQVVVEQALDKKSRIIAKSELILHAKCLTSE